MKKVFISICFLSVLKFAAAQTVDRNYATNGFMEIYDVKGKPVTSKSSVEVEGSPLLNEQWAFGEVRLKNGQWLKDVPLQFNLQTNELYFQKNNTTFQFAEPVLQFSLAYTEEGAEKKVLFRAGYPPADGKTANTFYQVLAEGPNVHLLKYVFKSVKDVYQYNAPGKKRYWQMEELYLFDASTNRLINITKNKTPLTELLPAYAPIIKESVKEKKGKLLPEQEWIELVQLINQKKAF
ncbi:MAG: hypothetical protein M3342_22615 [Bacteroidota bacterium]|nr:hypothetical protein [Bacteroidota bacterium]